MFVHAWFRVKGFIRRFEVSILFLIMMCVKQMILRYVQQFYWWYDSRQGC